MLACILSFHILITTLTMELHHAPIWIKNRRKSKTCLDDPLASFAHPRKLLVPCRLQMRLRITTYTLKAHLQRDRQLLCRLTAWASPNLPQHLRTNKSGLESMTIHASDFSSASVQAISTPTQIGYQLINFCISNSTLSRKTK